MGALYHLLGEQLLSAVQLGGGISGCRWCSDATREFVAHVTDDTLRVSTGNVEVFSVALRCLTCVEVQNERCRMELLEAPTLNWAMIFDKWKLPDRPSPYLDWLKRTWSPRLLILTFQDPTGAVLALRARMVALSSGIQLEKELPTWAEAIPVFLYKEWTRRWLQNLAVFWSIMSILWASWELYQNHHDIVALIRNATAPLMQVMLDFEHWLEVRVMYVRERTLQIDSLQCILNFLGMVVKFQCYVVQAVLDAITAIANLLCSFAAIVLGFQPPVFQDSIAMLHTAMKHLCHTFRVMLPVQLLASRYLPRFLQLQGWLAGHFGLRLSEVAMHCLNIGRAQFVTCDSQAQWRQNVNRFVVDRLVKMGKAASVVAKNKTRPATPVAPSDRGTGVGSMRDLPDQADEVVSRSPVFCNGCLSMKALARLTPKQ